MTNLIKHLRYALRQLRKSPGFTAVAVMTLALGIGATTAIYTVLYATFLAPMPYPNADQLVMVWSKIGGGRDAVSAADFLDWKRQGTVFQDLNAWSGRSFNLGNAQNPEQVDGHVITPGWFKMQGFHFFLGSDFLPEEGEPGRDHVVILMHNLWERITTWSLPGFPSSGKKSRPRKKWNPCILNQPGVITWPSTCSGFCALPRLKLRPLQAFRS